MVTSRFHATILTLFPDMFPGPLGFSLAGKALESGVWSLKVMNIRDFAHDRHKTVDDAPFGGGAGMVMRPDVLGEALEVATQELENPKILYMSPRGPVLKQKTVKTLVKTLANTKNLVILCGRFEGVDERVLETFGIEEVSIGDYILSGGEIAAMALLDACVRLLPGVMGNAETLAEESFGGSENEGAFAGLLEYPHYTRPAEWRGRKVPEVLVSGNHAAVDAWRLKQAEEITRERRKDLWELYEASLGANQKAPKKGKH